MATGWVHDRALWGRTVASLARLATREVDEALTHLFPERARIRPFEWLGQGYTHTSEFGSDFCLLPPALKRLEEQVLLSGRCRTVNY
jgi:hypothetical protein